jgi:hypothetical protein
MKRLEIIHLRLAGSGPEGFAQRILKSIENHTGLVSVQVYRSFPMDTDLSIHLHLDANPEDSHATELGVRLAVALKEHGMVKHSVWKEELSQDGEVGQ